LILARELASNLATPMFLLDPGGMLVYYNDAAATLLGRSFAELGEIPSGEFGEALQLTTPDGEPIRRRDSPAGIAFFERRPAHETLVATAYNASLKPPPTPCSGQKARCTASLLCSGKVRPENATADASQGLGMSGICSYTGSRHRALWREYVVC
jgi:hypothetical protein